MKAAWIKQFGGPEVIQVGERAESPLGRGDVRVRIEAATLNHRDIYLRRGEAGRVPLPVILGSDGAGVIVDAAGTTSFKTGERVAVYPVVSCGQCAPCAAYEPHKCVKFGMVGGERDGTHAEFAIVPAANLVSLPAELDFNQGAAISLAGLTAWNIVMEEGRVREGEHALVLGASGGVGVFTVLLLKRQGAIVHVVTGSPEKREALLELGADYVLSDDPAAVLRHTRQLPNLGVDVAFNWVGGNTWRYVLPAVTSGGRVLVCGTLRSPVAELDMRQIFYRSISVIGCTMGTKRSLQHVLEVAAREPRFRSPISQEIPLEMIPDGHRRMEAGAITGKIVVHPSMNGKVS